MSSQALYRNVLTVQGEWTSFSSLLRRAVEAGALDVVEFYRDLRWTAPWIIKGSAYDKREDLAKYMNTTSNSLIPRKISSISSRDHQT